MAMTGVLHDHGAPSWNGDPLTFDEYRKAAKWYKSGLKTDQRPRAAARLWSALEGAAKEVAKELDPEEFECENGVNKLLDVLQKAPLIRMPIPDAYAKIETYDELQRRHGEAMGEYIIREPNAYKEMVAALKKVRGDRRERRRRRSPPKIPIVEVRGGRVHRGGQVHRAVDQQPGPEGLLRVRYQRLSPSA